jgi:thioredoxin reductase
MVTPLIKEGRVTLHEETIITAISDDGDGLQLVIEKNDQKRILQADFFLTLIGFKPNSNKVAAILQQGLGGPLALDREGYIIVDQNQATSLDGIYAVGDVCNVLHPCVATAVAQGTMAARTFDRHYGRKS